MILLSSCLCTGLRGLPGPGAFLQAKQTPKANVSPRRRRKREESEDRRLARRCKRQREAARAGITSSSAPQSPEAVHLLLLRQGASRVEGAAETRQGPAQPFHSPVAGTGKSLEEVFLGSTVNPVL